MTVGSNWYPALTRSPILLRLWIDVINIRTILSQYPAWSFSFMH
jgi:hypothetical protein